MISFQINHIKDFIDKKIKGWQDQILPQLIGSGINWVFDNPAGQIIIENKEQCSCTLWVRVTYVAECADACDPQEVVPCYGFFSVDPCITIGYNFGDGQLAAIDIIPYNPNNAPADNTPISEAWEAMSSAEAPSCAATTKVGVRAGTKGNLVACKAMTEKAIEKTYKPKKAKPANQAA